MLSFNDKYYKEIAKKIFLTDSPTGYTSNVIKLIANEVEQMGYRYSISNKGTLEVIIDGLDNKKEVATSAHVDTLGLMVRSISQNGELKLTNIGGPLTESLDGEYCKIITRNNKVYTGTILSTSPSVHVFKDAHSKPRDIDNLIVRIDEKVFCKNDVQGLGIDNGDFITIDTKFEITPTGFLKSRFIDDKASAIILLMLLKYMKENNIIPRYKTHFYFVVYEEVGHGASSISDKISEFVTIDMGCVGLDLNGNEYACSICAKDSSGPYDYDLTSKLISIAKENKINYVVDIFPFYGSDIGAAYRAGKDVKGALIGSGVAASHGMERTHVDGIINTYNLLYLYLMSE